MTLTWKYGEHAERTTLCAEKDFPSQASVTSTKASCQEESHLAPSPCTTEAYCDIRLVLPPFYASKHRCQMLKFHLSTWPSVNLDFSYSPSVDIMLLFVFHLLSVLCMTWPAQAYLFFLIVTKVSSAFVCSLIHDAYFMSLHVHPAFSSPFPVLSFLSSLTVKHLDSAPYIRTGRTHWLNTFPFSDSGRLLVIIILFSQSVPSHPYSPHFLFIGWIDISIYLFALDIYTYIPLLSNIMFPIIICFSAGRLLTITFFVLIFIFRPTLAPPLRSSNILCT